MSVGSQNNNSRQICRDISGFKFSKKPPEATHVSYGTLSASHGMPFFLIREIHTLADIRNPLLLVWCPWKDQRDLGPL